MPSPMLPLDPRITYVLSAPPQAMPYPFPSPQGPPPNIMASSHLSTSFSPEPSQLSSSLTSLPAYIPDFSQQPRTGMNGPYRSSPTETLRSPASTFASHSLPPSRGPISSNNSSPHPSVPFMLSQSPYDPSRMRMQEWLARSPAPPPIPAIPPQLMVMQNPYMPPMQNAPLGHSHYPSRSAQQSPTVAPPFPSFSPTSVGYALGNNPTPASFVRPSPQPSPLAPPPNPFPQYQQMQQHYQQQQSHHSHHGLRQSREFQLSQPPPQHMEPPSHSYSADMSHAVIPEDDLAPEIAQLKISRESPPRAPPKLTSITSAIAMGAMDPQMRRSIGSREYSKPEPVGPAPALSTQLPLRLVRTRDEPTEVDDAMEKQARLARFLQFTRERRDSKSIPKRKAGRLWSDGGSTDGFTSDDEAGESLSREQTDSDDSDDSGANTVQIHQSLESVANSSVGESSERLTLSPSSVESQPRKVALTASEKRRAQFFRSNPGHVSIPEESESYGTSGEERSSSPSTGPRSSQSTGPIAIRRRPEAEMQPVDPTRSLLWITPPSGRVIEIAPIRASENPPTNDRVAIAHQIPQQQQPHQQPIMLFNPGSVSPAGGAPKLGVFPSLQPRTTVEKPAPFAQFPLKLPPPSAAQLLPQLRPTNQGFEFIPNKSAPDVPPEPVYKNLPGMPDLLPST